MKKLTASILISAFILAFICLIDSCSKPSSLTACIGTLPSAASAGVPVAFTSCTLAASAYQWSFGDGLIGTGQTVTHIYAAAGTYTGTLTVTSNGSSNSKNFTITVVNNTWTFLSNPFTADSVVASVSGADLTAYGVFGSSRANLVFVFPSLPTASGSYRVVNAASGVATANQVYVIVYSYNSSNVKTIYGSTGSGNVSATVTASGGKLSVSLPTIEVVNQSQASDSTSFSATVNQTE